jgi:hypothetical protein
LIPLASNKLQELGKNRQNTVDAAIWTIVGATDGNILGPRLPDEK